MAILVSDNFNRSNDPTSLGTATTGQTWELVPGEEHILPGDPFGILSNQAFWNRDGSGESGDSYVVIDAGISDTAGQVRLMDVTAGGGLNLRNQGIVYRYVDASHYIFVAYFTASGSTGFRVYIADGGVPTARGFGADGLVMVNGDTIGYACCGQTIQAFHNGVLACEGFVGAPLSPTLLAGTRSGLMASGGILSVPPYQTYEDFLVTTNGTCTPTYNCTEDGCVDPGDGSGEFGTLAACLTSCGFAVSYNCVDGVCTDPGDGSGEFATLVECMNSGCGSVPSGVGTQRFDAGEGSSYYLVPPVIDSGNELRSKVVKSMRATGRRTNVSMKGYGFDINDEINVADLEAGTNASTRAQSLPDTTQVAQSPRKQINVKNAVLSTVRLEGDDTGNTERDEIHEIVVEQADAGVRR